MTEAKDLIQGARRIAALGQLVETFDTPVERKEVIMGLFACGAIKASTADLLMEIYWREIA